MMNTFFIRPRSTARVTLRAAQTRLSRLRIQAMAWLNLLGVAEGGSTGTPTTPATSTHYLGGYFQDDWRVLPTLTLNLGIRYEIQTAPTYRHNFAASFDPTIPNPIGTAIGQTLPGALVFATPGNR